jgi:transposase
MIVPAQPTIYVAQSAVDLRWGADRLAGLVRERFGRNPRDGALFVFLNKARNRLKVLFIDASGAWVLYKRLERGRFPQPTTLDAQATHIAISAEEMRLLVQGLESGRPRPVRRPPLLH